MADTSPVAKKPRNDIVEEGQNDLAVASSPSSIAGIADDDVLTKKAMAQDPVAEDCPSDFVVLDAWEPGEDSEEPQCFVWDAQPDSSNPSEVPIYRSKFSSVLKEFDEEEQDKNAAKKNAPQRNSCFNCLGDHIMNECPKPRNFQAITKNRRDFMNKFRGFGKQNTRYHLGDDQVYAHLKPGQLTTELRKALKLSDNQIPRHVYKMRVLGYPPAWLEEAKVSNSGMAMFGSTDDVNSNANDDRTEKYDISKIIDFPGFNVEPSAGTKDDYRHLHFPPMSSRQNKTEMIQHLERLNSSGERKKHRSSPKPDVEDLIVIDDLEDSVDDVKMRESSSSPSDDLTTERDSPSLADLETQKQLLMAELECTNNSMNRDSPSTPSQAMNLDSPSTPCQSMKVGQVKHIEQGTPILKSASPYTRIPAADNFSIGVCDVINFENLPNSTGHYLRMNDIITKIRKSTGSVEK